MTILSGKRILLIIAGGIAAYKSLELIRELKKRKASVRCVLTRAAKEFVTPLSVSSLSGEKIYDDLFSLTDEAEMGHIELSRDADLLVVAPATADLMAKMAQGLASDLASTLLLATDKRVLIAPAMNVRMWEHAATRRNLSILEKDGILLVGPNEGEMACGEFGPGRMAEPLEIVAAIEQALKGPALLPLLTPQARLEAPIANTLTGKHVLITAGPTHEPLDPVRYIANRSSGKQGYALAQAALAAGARVTLVSGPVTLEPPRGINFIRVETALQMEAAVKRALPADIAIFAAAVADWRAEGAGTQKIKKSAGGPPKLNLVENPDILSEIAHLKLGRPRLVVGFAAETENVIENAIAKRARKGCDLIIANDVSLSSGISGGVMGGDENRVHIIGEGLPETLPKMSKIQLSNRLIDYFSRYLE